MKTVILSIIIVSSIVLSSVAVNAYAYVAKMTLYIDGNPRDTQGSNLNTANLNFDWSTYSEKPGWHTITVTATDNYGNIGIEAENVLVDQRLH